MTRGKFYSIAMPIAAILYLAVLFIAHSGTVAAVAVLLFPVVAVLELAFGGRQGAV